jgi:hypothetical protein
MANIKLFGNTKIQGKAFFDLSESAPEPTYSIEKSVSSVDEGASVTFTLTTTNVANGTEVPYTITGISAADITSGSLTGNFTVNSNTATVTITATADQLTEGAETATLTLDNVADFDSVTVNDTSLTPFSPTDIAGLKGWYDYTYGVYRTNANDTTDDQYANVSFGTSTGNVSYSPNLSLFGGKNFYGSNGGNYLRYQNNVWRLNYVSGQQQDGVDEDGNPMYGPAFTTIDASGDTQYPWQANWSGTSNNVTRVATTNSVLATNGQTVAKWANKAGNIGNIYGGNMIQDTLSRQPLLRSGYIELDSDQMSANFGNSITAQRTYYFVGRADTNVSAGRTILASSTSSIFRNALISRLAAGGSKFGLSQGTAANSSFDSDDSFSIVCASFETFGSGKIRANNQPEETLTVGSNFSNSNSLVLGSTSASSFADVKEILFFEGAHTTEQKTQVINYLNAKHNVF